MQNTRVCIYLRLNNHDLDLDLDTPVWPRYSKDVPAYHMKFVGRGFQKSELEQNPRHVFCSWDFDPMTFNPLKGSGVRWLHFEVLIVIQV